MIIVTIILAVMLITLTAYLMRLHAKHRHLRNNSVSLSRHEALKKRYAELAEHTRGLDRQVMDALDELRGLDGLTRRVKQLEPLVNHLPAGANIHYVDSGLGTYFVQWCETGSMPHTGCVTFPQGIGFRDDVAYEFSKLSGGRFKLDGSGPYVRDCDAIVRSSQVDYKLTPQEFSEALDLLRRIHTQPIGLKQMIE